MSVTNNFIFDRSPLDVERWRKLRDKGWANMADSERQEWLFEVLPTPSAAKGMYTHNDLNRVENGVKELAIKLKKMGYRVPAMDIKTNWTYKDTLTKAEMARYLSNIETIRGITVVYSDTPKTPSIDKKFDHSKANDIEKILHDVFTIANKTMDSWCYAGEIISGEV